jgi:hypothetical protein
MKLNYQTNTLIQSVHKLIVFNDNYSNNILYQKQSKGFKV